MSNQSRLVLVFMSSILRDFIEEHDELVKRVFPELRRRCRAPLLKNFVKQTQATLVVIHGNSNHNEIR